jgi:DNA replication protein DnaC
MRHLAPELLLAAKTQRWAPEELLRTLVEAEITPRDASNARARLKAAAFPVTKTLEEFDVGVSSLPAATSGTPARSPPATAYAEAARRATDVAERTTESVRASARGPGTDLRAAVTSRAADPLTARLSV